ncbi:MAG: hypothetical protein ACK2TZ_03735 [Anaerolineales bacterium]
MAKFIRKLISNVQYYHLLILGILILALAVSCRASEQGSQVTPELELTETAASLEASLQVSPTAEIAAAEAEPEEVDECLACHTDKQELIDTADPVVVVAAENSGEG